MLKINVDGEKLSKPEWKEKVADEVYEIIEGQIFSVNGTDESGRKYVAEIEVKVSIVRG